MTGNHHEKRHYCWTQKLLECSPQHVLQQDRCKSWHNKPQPCETYESLGLLSLTDLSDTGDDAATFHLQHRRHRRKQILILASSRCWSHAILTARRSREIKLQSNVLGRLLLLSVYLFFPFLFPCPWHNVEQNLNVCAHNLSVVSQHWGA